MPRILTDTGWRTVMFPPITDRDPGDENDTHGCAGGLLGRTADKHEAADIDAWRNYYLNFPDAA